MPTLRHCTVETIGNLTNLMIGYLDQRPRRFCYRSWGARTLTLKICPDLHLYNRRLTASDKAIAETAYLSPLHSSGCGSKRQKTEEGGTPIFRKTRGEEPQGRYHDNSHRFSLHLHRPRRPQLLALP